MKIIKLFGYGITIISVIYLGITLRGLSMARFAVSLNFSTIQMIAFASIVNCVLIFICAYSWRAIMCYLANDKVSISFKQASSIYIQANISKYLPGNIFQYVQRNVIGGQQGWSQGNLALSSAIETLCIFLAVLGMLIILVTLGFGGISPGLADMLPNKLILYGATMVALVFLALYFKSKLSGAAYENFSSSRFLRLIVKIVGTYSLLLIMLGAMFAWIYSSLYPLQFTLTLQTIGIFQSAVITSWVLGFITPGSPAGLGVRESMLLVLLGAKFGQEQVLLSALVLRCVTIIGDLLAFAVSWLISRFSVAT
jgi:hypothetical protein